MPQEKHRLSREEVAKREIGCTEMSPLTARVCAACFLLAIVAVPVVQHARELSKDRSRLLQTYDILQAGPSAARAFRKSTRSLAGRILAANAELLRAINQYEEDLEDSSFLSECLLGPVQALMARCLGQGNEKAYVGRHGWLYYRPGVDHVTGPGFLDPGRLDLRRMSGNEYTLPPQPNPLLAILDFHRQLKTRGIQLVIVPTPVKAQIHPEQLSSRFRPGGPIVRNPSFGTLTQEMKKQGVLVFDPARTLANAFRATGKPQFLKTDTHWTPDAMDAVAQALAVFVRRHAGSLSPGAPLDRMPVRLDQLGDIATMLKLPVAQDLFARETVVVQQVYDPRTRLLWRPRKDGEVLLLGDSFSNIYSLQQMGWGESAGLAEQLSYHLGATVDRMTQNSDGAYATRAGLAADLRRGRDRLAGKKIVIWQFAARELSVGDWKLLGMSLGQPQPTAFIVPARGAKRLISGTVEAASPVPRPGSVPYRDHIMQIHMRDLKDSAGEAIPGAEALVNTWSMRSNLWTRAARAREGQSMQFCIEPWAGEALERYGRINQSKLSDRDIEGIDDADPCWGEDLSGGEAAEPSGTPVLPVSGTAATAEAREQPRDMVEAFQQDCRRMAEASDVISVRGKDDWLFLKAELAHLGRGRFWGEDAPRVSASIDPANADPLPAILDFKNQLDALGIALLVLPVPPKAVIYPEMISETVVPAGSVPRLDAQLQAFYQLLRDAGVTVIDMTDEMISGRFGAEGEMYCRTDTHWAGPACVRAAELIADQLREHSWFEALPRETYAADVHEVSVVGDLVAPLPSELRPAPESLVLRSIRPGGAPSGFVRPRESSPVLLMGDSYCLIFHAGGDMFEVGAGLPDQLAYELGFPVDVLARRAAGSTAVRSMLYRRVRKDPGCLDNKKAIIWCFSAREFTESSSGWAIKDVKKRVSPATE